MNDDQAIYRRLWEDLLAYKGSDPFGDLLVPWTDEAHTEQTWLTSLASTREHPWPQLTADDLCRLYAFSRVNQILLMAFQTGLLDAALPELKSSLTLEEYMTFMQSFGLSLEHRYGFHPFYHEIVEVLPAANHSDPIEIQAIVWPCLMLGAMMFSRAGCVVTGGARHITKEIAENSTLYWAHRRADRPCADISDGWGSSSQWRTAFRRDYRVDGRHCFNVDETNDLMQKQVDDPSADRDGLNVGERTELLTHRCFLLAEAPHNDLWPYDDVLINLE